MEPRLPAHVEVGALVRRVQSEGGFATVLRKGEPDAGTILVVTVHNGANARLWERMPAADGTRQWLCARSQDSENPGEFDEYLSRRRQQDVDLWIIELDIVNGERFIGLKGSTS